MNARNICKILQILYYLLDANLYIYLVYIDIRYFKEIYIERERQRERQRQREMKEEKERNLQVL